MINPYDESDLIVLARKVEAWNKGVKPVIFIKNISVLKKFPLIFSENKSKRVENICGYEIILQGNNPIVKDNRLVFVSIMEDGSWGKVIGELIDPFELSIRE